MSMRDRTYQPCHTNPGYERSHRFQLAAHHKTTLADRGFQYVRFRKDNLLFSPKLLGGGGGGGAPPPPPPPPPCSADLEQYAKTISWIRAKTSFALLRPALICLRGSRTTRRVSCDSENVDFDVETAEAAIY